MKNYTNDSALNKKVDEVILRFANTSVSNSEFKRQVEKLTFDASDFFACNGFTTEEAYLLTPKALNIRKDIIREFKQVRPDFYIADTPVEEFDERLYLAADSDIFVCECIYNQLDRYFGDESRQDPDRIFDLLNSNNPKTRFGGLMALGFTRPKSSFIVDNIKLCEAIASLIASEESPATESAEKDVKPAKKEDKKPEQVPNPKPTTACAKANDAAPAKSEKKEPEAPKTPTAPASEALSDGSNSKKVLMQKIVAQIDVVTQLLSYYNSATKYFTQEEIDQILTNSNIRTFIDACNTL